MNRTDIIQAIAYIQVNALKERETREVNIQENIISVLTWALRFIDFFNQFFKNKNGEYRKPGWARAIAIVGVLFKLGLQLINLKKK